MVRNFERDAVALIAGHPDVTFDIYFPPYSILQFVSMRDASPATLKIVYDFSAYANRRLTSLPNVRLVRFSRREGNHPRSEQLCGHYPPLANDRYKSPVVHGGGMLSRNARGCPLLRLSASNNKPNEDWLD